MTDEHEQLQQHLFMRRVQHSTRPANFLTMTRNILLVIFGTCLLVSLGAWLVSYVGIDLADRDELGYVSLSGGAIIAQRAEFASELQQPNSAEWLGLRYMDFGNGDYFLRVPIWMMVVVSAIATAGISFSITRRHRGKHASQEAHLRDSGGLKTR